MPPVQPDLLFDLDHLLDANPGPPSPVYYVYAVFFLVVLGVGAYGYFVVRPTFGNKLRRYYARTLSIGAMILGGVGVVLVLSRFLTVPYLSARILTYFWLAITVIYAIFVLYFLNRVQPRRLREYQDAYTRLQFRPRPRPGKTSKKKRRK